MNSKILDAIKNVGFPIVIALYLMLQVVPTISNLTKEVVLLRSSIENQSRVIENLNGLLTAYLTKGFGK